MPHRHNYLIRRELDARGSIARIGSNLAQAAAGEIFQ